MHRTQSGVDQLVRRIALVFTLQAAISSAHHIYGGLVYDSVVRLAQPFLALVELLVVFGLLYWYRRSRAGWVLTAFVIAMLLVGIVQGLFHSLYGHVYKDLLFLAGIGSDRVRDFFLPVTPNDFVYPPNDVFFEATGVAEVVTIWFIAVYTRRLVRLRQEQTAVAAPVRR
jgi:hypothetical protein